MKYRVIGPILLRADYVCGIYEEEFVPIGRVLDSNNDDDRKVIKDYPSRVELIELPEKWFCEVTNDNIEMLREWGNANAKSHTEDLLRVGYLVLSKHHLDDSLFLANSKSYMMRTHPHYYKDYTELTTEEFRKLVYEPFKQQQKMNQNQETHKIDFGKLIEIRNLACSEWKQKISKGIS